jgi:hypothetical protein
MLTKEEKINIAKFVMESYQGITITEAKSNNNIREEIQMNFKYYTAIKEIFKLPKGTLAEGNVILSILGNVKDFMTGSEIVKNWVVWLQEKISAIAKYFTSKMGPYIPEPVKKGAEWVSNAAKKTTEWIKWILEALTPNGLARLFAMFKFGTLKPTQEQKDCMYMLAKKVYVTILITLVIAYLIKVGGMAVVGKAVNQASIMPIFTPIAAAFTKAGVSGILKLLSGKFFSAYSAGSKAKSAIKKSKEIDAKEEKYELDSKGKSIIQSIKDEFKEYRTGWKEAWNQCQDEELKKVDKEGDFDPSLLANSLKRSMKGLGTDEKVLFAALKKLNSKDEKYKQDVIKWYKEIYKVDLEKDIKSDLSGDELKQALSMIKEDKFYKPIRIYESLH